VCRKEGRYEISAVDNMKNVKKKLWTEAGQELIAAE
jgi:hypothetical protein